MEGQGADAYPSRKTRVDVDDDGEEEAIVEASPSNVPSDNTYHEGVLDDTGPAVDSDPFAGKEPNRVLGGYKAALHSKHSLL